MDKKVIAGEILGLAKSLVASFVKISYSATYKQITNDSFSRIIVDIDLDIDEADGRVLANKINESEEKMKNIANKLGVVNWWQDEGWYSDNKGLHCVYVFQYRGDDSLVSETFKQLGIKIEVNSSED
jgi:hypothetical protein